MRHSVLRSGARRSEHFYFTGENVMNKKEMKELAELQKKERNAEDNLQSAQFGLNDGVCSYTRKSLVKAERELEAIQAEIEEFYESLRPLF